MGYIRYNALGVTGDANGLGAGSTVTGTAVFIGQQTQRAENISAIVTALAETASLTWAGGWQVSNDASTWFTLSHAPQNPAAVVLTTGTTGVDAAVSKVLTPPRAIYGYKFARAALTTAGATGATTDTYAIAYAYRQLDHMERPFGHLRFAAHIASGNATGVAPAAQVNGNTLFVGGSVPKITHLSALVTALADTNTLTLTAKWQGSNDKSTWYDLSHDSQNPAGVALATGTAGADTAVARAVPAPDSVYSYQFARCSLIVGVVTGTTNDTYSIGYSYRQRDAGGRVEW